MKIVAGDIYSTVVSPRSFLRALAAIREVCRARPSGFQYMPKYKAGMWDGYITLMASVSSFPTGLLPIVVSKLNSIGQEVEVMSIDGSGDAIALPVRDDILNGITLRDYQVEAVSKLIEAGRGVAKMATNSGKTEVMAAIIKALDFKKTIVLLHRKELLHQTADRFQERLGMEIGRIGDSIWDPKNITVAMIQTLSGKIGNLDLNNNRVVMVDECHHASSNTMIDVLKLIPGCYRFGFSGTPLKNDLLSDLKLIAYTGDVVYDVDNRYMISHNYSANPVINVCVVEETDEDIWEMKYTDAYSNLIVENAHRNGKVKQFAESESGTVLILVERVKHGKLLQKSIKGSVFVHGGDDIEYRRKVLRRMDNGGGVYIATPIFDEGVDVPAINSIILAGAGKNHVKILQRIGRGLRFKSENNTLTVYDFIDDTNKYLFRQSSKRMKLYASEGFKTTLL